MLIAHNHRALTGPVNIIDGAGAGRDVGGIDGKSGRFQRRTQCRRLAVPDHADPFFGRGGRLFAQFGKLFLVIQQVDFRNSDGVAGAQDGADIVRIVDVFADHRQIRLAAGEDLFHAFHAPVGWHKAAPVG